MRKSAPGERRVTRDDRPPKLLGDVEVGVHQPRELRELRLGQVVRRAELPGVYLVVR